MTPPSSPHSRPFRIITAALEELGFHEDGESSRGFVIYRTYRSDEWVTLDDSADIPLDRHIATVLDQTKRLERDTLERAVANVREQFD